MLALGGRGFRRAGGGRRRAVADVQRRRDALVQARVEAEHVKVVGRGGGRLREQEVVMVVVLWGQRVQTVHDHGGRRGRRRAVGSAGTHYTGVVLGTTRVSGQGYKQRDSLSQTGCDASCTLLL